MVECVCTVCSSRIPWTIRSAEYSVTPAALEARHVYWPPFSGVTESMTSMLVRWPTRSVATPSRDETLDPRKCQWTFIGRSPSVAMHVTWVAEPASVASSPKKNGAIFGATVIVSGKYCKNWDYYIFSSLFWWVPKFLMALVISEILLRFELIACVCFPYSWLESYAKLSL